jgi:hypothetical protein
LQNQKRAAEKHERVEDEPDQPGGDRIEAPMIEGSTRTEMESKQNENDSVGCRQSRHQPRKRVHIGSA